MRVALACQPVDYWPSRITKPHNLGALVDGLACGVVNRLPQYFHVVVCVYFYNLRISSADKQTNERQFWNVRFFLVSLYKVCQYVSLQVVNLYERQAERYGKSFCERHAYK